jgi:hypothetical protein
MGRSYGSDMSLVNKGRVIPIELPAPYEKNIYLSPIFALGWLIGLSALAFRIDRDYVRG